ncbi:MAG: CAP domain-containing protein [Actinobacteria bacterium]|nr:CAP domain-containing protein [Actinomycetota bacterium]
MAEMHALRRPDGGGLRLIAGASVVVALVVTLASRTPAEAFSPPVRPSATAPVVARSTGVVPAEWLGVVNYYRGLANLPPVTEKASLSENDLKHAKYMVKNQVIGHSEDPSLPFYTIGGDLAARNSNLTHSEYAPTAPQAIASWMTAPFHALGILDPRLKRVGYGKFREHGHDRSFEFAAALDVLQGLGDSSGTTLPVQYPAPNKKTFLAKYSGGESPDPLTSCPGYSAPTGAPIMLQLTSFAPVVTSSLQDGNGNVLDHCVFDSSTYVNPSSGVQNDARAVLAARSAIVMIPKAPLTSGTTYQVSITAGLSTTAWSFKVGDVTAPITKVTTPVHGTTYDRDRLRALEGTAAGDDTRRVQISLAKYMDNRTCRFWTGSKFVTRGCTDRIWINAQGTGSWSYSLPSKLASSIGDSTIANYVLWSRGKDASGNVESSFKLGRNYAGFNVSP